MKILVDGRPSDVVPATDSTVMRGDGVFEAIRSYRGRLFALDEHLARLARSARMMEIDLPDGVADWCEQVASAGGDGIVRVVVSRGDALPGTRSGPRCIVVHHPLPASRIRTLEPVVAPWHPAGRPWELAGAKTTSYGPNLAAGREARRRGADDALLVSDENVVLEGPTFSVAWVVDGVLETPALTLGILDSITRRRVLVLAEDMGIRIEEGTFTAERLADASEAFVMSTVNEVAPLTRVGPWVFPGGPMASELIEAFRSTVASELGFDEPGR